MHSLYQPGHPTTNCNQVKKNEGDAKRSSEFSILCRKIQTIKGKLAPH